MPNILNPPIRHRPKLVTVMLPMIAIAVLGYTGNTLLTARANQTGQGHPTAVATSECCRIRVNSAKRSDPGSERMTVNVTIENLSSSPIQLSPGRQITLKDKAGAVHKHTSAYLPAGMSVGGTLKGKGSRTENLDFNVPLNTAGSTLLFTEDAATEPVILSLP